MEIYPGRRLDAEKLSHFLRRLDEANVGGVLIGASTGQGHLRTFAELEEWLLAAAEIPLKHARLMALLRPEDDESDNRRLIGRLAEAGYQVVFVRPGTNLSGTAGAGEIADNMLPLVTSIGEAGLATGLYSIPDVSGVAMPPESVVELLQSKAGERIIAIKITEANYEQSTQQFLQRDELKHLKIVQGWDPHLARAIQDGGQRTGVTSGPMSFALHQYLHMLDQASQANWDELAICQKAVTQVFAAMQDDPLKFADLQRAKVIMGLGQPLTAQVTEEQIDRVFVAVANLERDQDRQRMACSLDLLESGPYHDRLQEFIK